MRVCVYVCMCVCMCVCIVRVLCTGDDGARGTYLPDIVKIVDVGGQAQLLPLGRRDARQQLVKNVIVALLGRLRTAMPPHGHRAAPHGSHACGWGWGTRRMHAPGRRRGTAQGDRCAPLHPPRGAVHRTQPARTCQSGTSCRCAASWRSQTTRESGWSPLPTPTIPPPPAPRPPPPPPPLTYIHTQQYTHTHTHIQQHTHIGTHGWFALAHSHSYTRTHTRTDMQHYSHIGTYGGSWRSGMSGWRERKTWGSV
jgi:hypothetical protein